MLHCKGWIVILLCWQNFHEIDLFYSFVLKKFSFQTRRYKETATKLLKVKHINLKNYLNPGFTKKTTIIIKNLNLNNQIYYFDNLN